MTDEIDRAVSRKARAPLVFLFWCCVIGFALFYPKDTANAEPPQGGALVSVPVDDMERLHAAHLAMLAHIAELEKINRILTDRAAMCIATFPIAKWQ